MDGISTALTAIDAIERVYRLTVLIRRIYNEAEEYPETAKVIQEKFDHELLFIEAFRDLFQSETGYLSPDELNNLPRSGQLILLDIENIFSRLYIELGKYAIFVEKYDILVSATSKGTSTTNDDAKSEETKKTDVLKKIKQWRGRTLGLRYEFALFDKEAILELLTQYSEWNDRLRQTMALLFTIKPYKPAPSVRTPALGMQTFLKWQQLASAEVPSNFISLPGDLEGLDEDSVAATETSGVQKSFTVADYNDGFGPQKVIVECRRYSSSLTLATEEKDEKEIKTLKEPLVSLAWLLKSASSLDKSENAKTATSYNSMKVLHCQGYLDEPDENRAFLIYQFPPAVSESEQDVRTLYALINASNGNIPSSKPSLNERFGIAYILANTLLSIHASKWLHKNIWSRSIAIFTPTQHSTQRYLIPYLAGWESARTTTSASLLVETIDPEQLLYRHPERYPDLQGKTQKVFSAEHDLYALGVVLLEIGLWRTLSSISQFAKGIASSRRSGKLPPGERIRRDLISRAEDGSLAREMGVEYAKAVARCLKTSFGTRDGDPEEDSWRDEGLQRGFREQVVEVIREGVKL